MSTRKVTIVYQGKNYDLDIDISEDVETFRLQIFSLINVPPERQKIVGIKGGILRDDTDLSQADIKNVTKMSHYFMFHSIWSFWN